MRQWAKCGAHLSNAADLLSTSPPPTFPAVTQAATVAILQVETDAVGCTLQVHKQPASRLQQLPAADTISKLFTSAMVCILL